MSKIRLLGITLALLLTAGAGFSVFAEDAGAGRQGITIGKITGSVRIITPSRKVFTVYAGGRIPSVIPSGSRIRALKGRVDVLAGGLRLQLKDKQELSVSFDGSTGTVGVSSSERNKDAVTVRCGASTVLLEAGAAARMERDEDGGYDIIADEGSVAVVTPDGRQMLAAGESLAVASEPSAGAEDTPVIPELPESPAREASPSILQ